MRRTDFQAVSLAVVVSCDAEEMTRRAAVHPGADPADGGEAEEARTSSVHDGRPDGDGAVHEEKHGAAPPAARRRLPSLARRLASSRRFESLILLSIVLSGLSSACLDYTSVGPDYEPTGDGSVRNWAIIRLERALAAVFAAECAVKIAAHGPRGYLRDGWNALDLAVAASSVASLVPGMPDLSVLRPARALRPLRSISRVPSLRRVVDAFLASLGDLANVMVLLCFVLVCFSLFGVTFWRGLLGHRCRLTPFPVRMPGGGCASAYEPCWADFVAAAATDPEAHSCLAGVPNDDPSWTVETSPWATPRDCVWLVDEGDGRICGPGGRGGRGCDRPAELSNGTATVSVERTCGSDHDAFGNARFVSSEIPYGHDRMEHATYNAAFNWGYTAFDSTLEALMTAFQCVTLEGWSEVMFAVNDGWHTAPSVAVFVLLIVLGGIVTVNIILAVVGQSLDRIEGESRREAMDEARGVKAEAAVVAGESALRRRLTSVVHLVAPSFPPAWRRAARSVASSRDYGRFILATIALNTVLLALDHHGISPGFQTVLDSGNFVTTLIFLVDMVISNVAMGVAYWRNGSTAFDGVIAISSALELLLARISAGGGQGKSVMSAFRSFRLVRLLRMVKNWKSIHSLLDTISRASSDIRSFAVLLSLLIFVFALMGMQVGARFPSVTLLVNYPPAVCEPASLRRCERASRGHLGPALRRRGRAPVELRRLHVEPGDRLPGAERRELEHGSVRLLEDVESGAGLLRVARCFRYLLRVESLLGSTSQAV